MKRNILYFLSCCLLIVSCREGDKKESGQVVHKIDSTSTYGYDRDFLKKYSASVELGVTHSTDTAHLSCWCE